MRHAQDGGLTAEQSAFREQVRLEVGEMFAAGRDNAEVAKGLQTTDTHQLGHHPAAHQASSVSTGLFGGLERATRVWGPAVVHVCLVVLELTERPDRTASMVRQG